MTALLEQLKVVLPEANEVQLRMTVMLVREALREELKADRKRDLARTRKRHQRDRERDISVTKTGHVTLVSPLDPPSGSLFPSQPPDPDARSISESSSTRYSADFLQFWALYPRKVGKEGAWKRWKTMKPDLAAIRAALSWQVKSRRWEDGFIWDPAKYLRDKHWLDERDISVTANGHAKPSPPMYDPDAEDPR